MSDGRWGDPREYGERDRDAGRPRVYDDERGRDDHDPREVSPILGQRQAAFVIEMSMATSRRGRDPRVGPRTRLAILRWPGALPSRTRLEGLFVDELERFQPTPGYMRLLKESVLRVWQERKASVKNEVASAEHRAKAIQQKLDRLDDAFIYQESIDLGTTNGNAIGFAKN